MLVPFLTRFLPFFSISAVQWLCNANKKSDIPAKRLYCFFASLYSVLVSIRSTTWAHCLSLPCLAGKEMK